MTHERESKKYCALLSDCRAILDRVESERRDLTIEEAKETRTMLDEAEILRLKMSRDKARAVSYRNLSPSARLHAEEREGNESRGRTIPPADLPGIEYRTDDMPDFRGDDLRNEGSAAKNERRYRAGTWIKGALLGDQRAQNWCQEHGVGVESRTMWSGNNFKGAVLIPDELAKEIIWNRDERGVWRQNARVVNLTSDTLTMPVLTQAPTATFLNSEEDGEFDESEPSYASITLTPREAGTIIKASRALVEDSVVDLAAHIAQVSGWAFADLEDGCGFVGDGSATYGGMSGLFTNIALAAHSASQVTATGKTSFGALILSNFVDMVQTLPQWAHTGAAWYISPVGYSASILRLITALAGNTRKDVESGDTMQFLGFPVRLSSKLNSVTSAQSGAIGCVLANLQLCGLIGDRRRMDFTVLRERYAEKSQIGFLPTQRFHAISHALGDTSTPGAAVALKFG